MSAALTYLPSPPQDPVSEDRANRWVFWRSPAGQPRWARPALLGIALVAAVLYAWNLPLVDTAPLYRDAARSMSESWKAFFYGAVDPQATYTLDKLAGSFVPQAISVKVFGYSAWSLALPQVIEGVVSVLVMYRVVRRWVGVVPGLLAAGIFTLTPVAASMFGHSMEDGALVVCLVLAVDSYQRAVLEGRLRSLVWAGVWVGLGFQTKMVQAWLILPALLVGYLLTAPIDLRGRLRHLGIAGVVMLAVSVAWVALYTVTPAADRPYVDGSTNNSAVAMVFGYNGLGRLGITLPGAREFSSSDGGSDGPNAPARPQLDLRPDVRGNPDQDPTKATSRENPRGWGKLFDGSLGVAVGWLFPLTLLALVFGLWWWRRSERTDQVRGGLVMWGIWLVTFGVVFTVGGVEHTAYVASLAPPIAALSAVGIVMFWRAYQRGGRAAWLLPIAVVAELAWGAWLWSHYPNFLPWAKWGTLAIGVAALIALILPRVIRNASSTLVTAALAVGVAAMLAAPATYAVSVLDPDYSGTSFDANAGPESGRIPMAPPPPESGGPGGGG
ncbi:ArnT family glycosyltransferase [Kutzneria sp. CA-103260]|uniref:ArnT family glycosyltransferase n=1 Tax=Kutzneria sp. CA-103260 TaxID=2802641 RepID=UPI001BA5D18E|nr:glycosyltransferase family 39 protein [Kutzneria sp. CA-103260]QUQ69284.1 mannosyltransferase [Kutzneria sp. CA-103260]